jgi:hypothetical protein
MDYREAGGADPLDASLPTVPAPASPRALDLLLRTRVALGLQPVSAPAVIFMPIGFALANVGILPRSALGHLEALVTLALCALGVFIGMGLDVRPRERRLLAAASVEALITIAVVGVATLFLLSRWGLHLETALGLVAAMLAVAASVSSASAPEHEGDPTHATTTRIADLDDAVSVVAGALVLAALTRPGVQGVLQLCGATIIVGALGGFAGWLLLERAHSTAERAVFVLGTIALIGGAAAYLNSSPVLAGLVAGVGWRYLPGHADRIVRGDVTKFQHPLVILLLVVAGALVELTPLAIWLLAPFIVFRLLGKLLGAWAAALLVPPIRATDLAAYLLSPGLLGIALTLNVVQVSSTSVALDVASAVAIGTLVSELLAFVALPGSGRA